MASAKKQDRMVSVLNVDLVPGDLVQAGPITYRVPAAKGGAPVVAKAKAMDRSKPAMLGGRRVAATVSQVDAGRIVDGVEDFLRKLGPLDRVSKAVEGFTLDEMTLSFAVNAEGGIELIGKATVGIEASLSVTLRPKQG